MALPVRPALALHGGCGTLRKLELTPALEAAHRQALAEALAAGWAVLAAGGPALDAVEAVVAVLEDCPLYNAGRGSVFTAAGTHEMDAAVMDGTGRRAGAVAAVAGVRHPVRLARAVLEHSGHVLLAGAGAGEFARARGLEFQPPEFFHTEARWRQLQEARAQDRVAMDHDLKFGTVGAVACDVRGGLAAATSTGGLTNKRWGRVGDSPVIGAGTFADDRSAAVSCTGYGEAFLRVAAAHDLAARVRHAGQSLAEAAAAVVHAELPAVGGEGGLIAVNAAGELALPFNTEGMYRAWQRAGEGPCTAIF